MRRQEVQLRQSAEVLERHELVGGGAGVQAVQRQARRVRLRRRRQRLCVSERLE